MTTPSLLNILILGATGVGKSSLLNAAFGYEVAKTGVVAPVTHGLRPYDGLMGGIPCKIYDSAGSDIWLSPKEYASQLSDLIDGKLALSLALDVETNIHLVWFLISAPSSRFTDRDAAILDLLREKGVPVIVVLSKSDVVSSDDIEAVKHYISNLSGIDPLDIIETSVNSRLGEPFGLREIIDRTGEYYAEIFPELLSTSQSSRFDIKASRYLLEELEDWKLEAKLENTKRYFYHTKTVDRISNGRKLYVIGRKGTGKTAICEYLDSIDRDQYFSEKLTFKSFPFNTLYALSDSGYTQPNQYITVWKYLIYSIVCKMLSENAKIDKKARNKLKKIFNQDISHALPKAVSEWTSFKLNLNIVGTGLTIGADKKSAADNSLNLVENVDTLESFIASTIDDSTYMVLFDELDEDYMNIAEEEGSSYRELLISLFKAVQDIRSKFEKFKILPIVFLRNDIYDTLQDSDKNKWSDYKVELDWNRESIKKLLAFRVSKAAFSNQDILPFVQAWRMAFTQENVDFTEYSSSEKPSIFTYIESRAYNRPRDFIKYIQICSEIAIEREYSRINSSTVKAGEKRFSRYLKAEIEDELYSVIPEIKEILNLLTKLRAHTMTVSDFCDIYAAEVKKGQIPERDYRYVLEMLFGFSVIGNVSNQSGQRIFRYENEEARLNLAEPICIHQGLLNALQIF